MPRGQSKLSLIGTAATTTRRNSPVINYVDFFNWHKTARFAVVSFRSSSPKPLISNLRISNRPSLEFALSPLLSVQVSTLIGANSQPMGFACLEFRVS